MTDDNKFPEQEAPEKNTDNAFVQVGKDGSPVMPDSDAKKPDAGTKQGDQNSDKK